MLRFARRHRLHLGGRHGGTANTSVAGPANVFCAVEPKAGRHFTFPRPDRSGFEFAQVICKLALQYPEPD